MTIIWIFYALETLFDTKAGENFRALLTRIELLLAPNKAEQSFLKKSMRKLYDMRSAIVHGGFDVIHPCHNELLDKAIEQTEHSLMDATDFGFQVLIASLQEIICRGWRWPHFKEVMEGVTS